MESLSVDTNQTSESNDVKNELIDQVVSSPTKLPVKSAGSINSNSKYMLFLKILHKDQTFH